MKPLTIEELKALQVGDWVWVSRLNNKRASGYVTDINFTARMFTCISVNRVSTTARIADYGKTWLAYKNKEQAESNGKWVELKQKWAILYGEANPYYKGDYAIQPLDIVYSYFDEHWREDYINPIPWREIVEEFENKEQAQQRLKELQGKNK